MTFNFIVFYPTYLPRCQYLSKNKKIFSRHKSLSEGNDDMFLGKLMLLLHLRPRDNDSSINGAITAYVNNIFQAFAPL